ATAGATAPVAVSVAAQDATPATPTTAAEDLGPAILFFNEAESEMVEAITARILPGTPDDPGAREAGVVYYIDRELAGTNQGYTVKTYTQGPYTSVTEDQASVEATSRTDTYQVVPVREADVSRYGYQSILTPQELYRRGLESLAAYAESEYGDSFSALTEDQQDAIVEALVADEAPGFDAPSGSQFFTMLRNHTIEGMFSDPLYGGNRDMVGWRLVGYPGARGFYTAEEMANPDFSADPVSLASASGHGH
ncbi:MAG: gluconate 2-dehydrogenase subunit 3 family protein, partial [Chloroflexota bacterium]|nr:gluconate 2-dehydrogenase subunit 3 family protein [Chloroflexota bacterium]